MAKMPSEIMVRVSVDKSIECFRKAADLSTDIKLWRESIDADMKVSPKLLQMTLAGIAQRIDAIVKEMPKAVVCNPYAEGQF